MHRPCAGLEGQQLDRKTASERNIGEIQSATPEETLATFGGLEIAMMAGAMSKPKTGK
jgi:NaMN:DMB phosphoribosyltransferase